MGLRRTRNRYNVHVYIDGSGNSPESVSRYKQLSAREMGRVIRAWSFQDDVSAIRIYRVKGDAAAPRS